MSDSSAIWRRAKGLARDLERTLDEIDKIHRPADVEELENCRSAVHSVMGQRPKFVTDDGTIWPMVPGDEFWIGPLRINGVHVEQLRFYPKRDENKNLEWVQIATFDGDPT